MKKRTAVGCILLTCLAGWLGAQQHPGDPRKDNRRKGGGLARGRSIMASSPNLQGLRTALSDKDGNFRFPLLPVGVYSLTFELAGFEKHVISAQEVRLGLSVDLSIRLKSSAVKEEVTVTASKRSYSGL